MYHRLSSISSHKGSHGVDDAHRTIDTLPLVRCDGLVASKILRLVGIFDPRGGAYLLRSLYEENHSVEQGGLEARG